MTVRDTPWPQGTPCWVDVTVPDPRMAMDFYGALLSWDFTDTGDEAGNYLMCSVGGKLVAGIGSTQPGMESMPAAWTTYLATGDVDKTAAAIGAEGGQLLVEPMDVESAGRLAVAADPTGAVFAVWQAGETLGVELVDTPSALIWNECMTRDFAAAKDFYGKVFGYGFDDMSGDGFTYATLTVGGQTVGGLGQLPEDTPAEVPAHWMAYFGVTDTDAAVARVGELGGSVLRPPQDSPYGRMSAVTDNQGAAFSLISVTSSD
ncbi:lactoylglutathione lyase family protein [Saccharomonospora marina XMU15]|uniref:Lactoylglutathione lyase family protein n=1 Tax=Saccharomonospora marina XMU15 TaxID=882083 RepID=H5X958_9PSEU|nr:VOC family protein [Saccharomonospora marina]EHR49160.1 lactoylglutathione lyase family protein [Saccharomonospora marina XMU15]